MLLKDQFVRIGIGNSTMESTLSDDNGASKRRHSR